MLVHPSSAAQYVRMSTDMQTHSIENQSAAIATYALEHQLNIVRTYVDAGKSGLRAETRDALLDLLEHVSSGAADYKHLLIYDISRWGRFQDPDESAHYEFICRRSGISVHYCAEQFENDGTLMSSIMKNLKRAMAAEYSRELSTKIQAGRVRVASKGLFFGCRVAFGLRRLLVDENRVPKGELRRGEWKSIRSDRIILAPGDPVEVALVRRIYDMFANEGHSLASVARTLNNEGYKSNDGRPWIPVAVRRLLSNEAYIGNIVYNRTSRKLKSKKKENPPGEWIRFNGALPAIIPRELFSRTQARLIENAANYTEHELLNYLTAIWCIKGVINYEALKSVREAPTWDTYAKRFGNLSNACLQIGYKFGPMFRTSAARIRESLAREIIDRVHRVGGKVKASRGLARLKINDEFTLTIVIARNHSKNMRFRNYHFGNRRPDLLIIVRTSLENGVSGYFALPSIFFSRRTWFQWSDNSYGEFSDFWLDTLDPIYNLCSRVAINEQ